jgi:hypothetical protein
VCESAAAGQVHFVLIREKREEKRAEKKRKESVVCVGCVEMCGINHDSPETITPGERKP